MDAVSLRPKRRNQSRITYFVQRPTISEICSDVTVFFPEAMLSSATLASVSCNFCSNSGSANIVRSYTLFGSNLSSSHLSVPTHSLSNNNEKHTPPLRILNLRPHLINLLPNRLTLLARKCLRLERRSQRLQLRIEVRDCLFGELEPFLARAVFLALEGVDLDFELEFAPLEDVDLFGLGFLVDADAGGICSQSV